ncbi:uncharacterized protein LOC106668469 [Cimex lectularius]|uniref:Uncharacterized protein n=1 Tax=Cimex lectularius TaxID=79782 RepID=A0A8I6RWL6_CIMLE|nr:uncharacterized protein LOC106668469 [Cimex lectularius]
MSQRSDDTTKGGCCFPGLFADKATRADVRRAFYRISQLEKKINQITKEQEKLSFNKSSSKIDKKKHRKCTKGEKEMRDASSSGLFVHAAESVYVKREEDAPSLITLPCGCVLEKRTLYATSEVEYNEKNVPKSLSTCGCGLTECKAAPSVSQQKCQLDCVDVKSCTCHTVVEKSSCHSHKGIINIVTEQHAPPEYAPLKSIRSCVCGQSNSSQTACRGGTQSSENCLKSATVTASTQTCRGHPPRIGDESEMSVGYGEQQQRRAAVCRNRRPKLALGVLNNRYKLSQTQLPYAPLRKECEEVPSGALLTPEECESKLQSSNQQPAIFEKSPWGWSKKRTDKKNKKRRPKFQPGKSSYFPSRVNTLSSKSSSEAFLNSSEDRQSNKRKKNKQIKAFVTPVDNKKNMS